MVLFIVGGLHLKMPDSICDVKALKRNFDIYKIGIYGGNYGFKIDKNYEGI